MRSARRSSGRCRRSDRADAVAPRLLPEQRQAGRGRGPRRWPSRSIFPFVAQQQEHAQQPASSPSRPRRECAEAAEPRRGFQLHSPGCRRGSDCRKSLLTPRSDRFKRPNRSGQCVQEEGGYEYASCHPHAENGKEEAHVESAVLVQPLVGEGAEGNEGGGEGADTLGFAVPICSAGMDGPCTRTVEGNGKKHEERCAKGLLSTGACRKYWAHHRTGGITGKDVTCTFVGAVGGVFGDFPGAIGAGGLCVALYP